MLLDIWQERGWSDVVELFGDDEECRFPLFDVIKPLPLVWMYVVYLVLCIGKSCLSNDFESTILNMEDRV